MSRKQPRTPPKYSVGDRVEIVSNLRTGLTGRRGVIVQINRNRQAHTLDKYEVRFEGSERIDNFWGMELRKLGAA
jgi:hypothetical protein